MSRKVLIAGCGDVGTRLAEQLTTADHQVVALRRSWASRSINAFTPIECDLLDRRSLVAIPQQIEQIVYCPTPGERSEAAYRSIYLDGVRNLMAAVEAASVSRLIFVSSTAVYGQNDGGSVDETSPTQPVQFNGKILREAEQLAHDSGIPATVIRLAGIYGPGRNQLLDRVRAGARCQPGYWTNRIHADDAAAAIAHILGLAAPADCYVGVDNAPAHQCEVMSWLARKLNAPAPTIKTDKQSANKRCLNTRLRQSGFAFRYPDFRYGYADTLNALVDR